MDFIFSAYGHLLVYLLMAGVVGLVGAIALAITAGWAIASVIHYLVHRSENNEDELLPVVRLVILSALTIAVIVGVGLSVGFDFWLSYWLLWLSLLAFSTLSFAVLRWWSMIGVVVFLFAGAAMTYVFVNTLEPVELGQSFLEVKIRGRETIDEQDRISLILTDPETKEEIDTYYVYGEDWGLRVVTFNLADSLPGLGGKKYIRRDALIGYEGVTETLVPLQAMTEPAWAVIQKKVEKLFQITDLDVQQTLNAPSVGQSYEVKLSADNKLVIEPIGAIPEQESTPTSTRPPDEEIETTAPEEAL